MFPLSHLCLMEAIRNGDSSIRLAWIVLVLMGLAPPYA